MSLPLWILDPFFWLYAASPPLGLFLCVLGWRGRREDETPHCRTCGYNLTGLSSARCPECGTFLNPQSVTQGRRRRSYPALGVGLLLLVLAIGHWGPVLYHRVHQINWYNHRSFSSLLREAEGGGPDAIDELRRRVKWKLVGRSQVDDLLAAALRHVETQPPPPNIAGWFGTLSRLVWSNLLTPAQTVQLKELTLLRVTSTTSRDRLGWWLGVLEGLLRQGKVTEREVRWLAQAALRGPEAPDATNQWEHTWCETLNLLAASGLLNEGETPEYLRACIWMPDFQVRPRVLRGACLPVEVTGRGWGGDDNDWVCEPASVTILAGELVLEEERPIGWGGVVYPDDENDHCLDTAALPPGTHELKCRVTYRCSRLDRRRQRVAAILVDKVATATTEILNPWALDDLCLEEDPFLRAAFAQHLSVRWWSDGAGAHAGLFFQWRTELPIDGVFDVFVRAGDEDLEAGHLVCRRGFRTQAMIALPQVLLDEAQSRTVYVVLRTNPEVARATVDMDTIWDGELILGPVILDEP